LRPDERCVGRAFLRRDDRDLVVFCFKEPEGAQAFCDRFGGEQFTEGRRINVRDPYGIG
jgi:hypothetical protein